MDAVKPKYLPQNFRILIADDEITIRNVLAEVLRKEGYIVDTAEDGTQAIEKLRREQYHIVFADFRMPGADGITVLKELKQISPDSEAVIITGYGTIASAVEALRAGAYDYITKPFHPDEIILLVRKIIEHNLLRQENINLRQCLQDYVGFPQIIGHSPVMQKVFNLIRTVANTDATVLISGESGTGKELIARAIHYNSRRANNPLVVVNCAAIPEELLESELFGYVKGAFTGAYTSKQGRFELAHTGTIFLDEIGDMSLRLQAKILRLLEEREFEPLGSTRTIKVDVRIIAATNKNLEEAVRKNQFREDLYYRLHVVPIYVPPLRERLEDLPLLINHFVNLYNKKLGRNVQGFSPGAIEVLSKHPWPGNVRELENLVEQMIVLYSKGIIDVEHLPDNFKQIRKVSPFHLDSQWQGEKIDLNQALSSLECELIRQAIVRAGGNKSRAAELLGLKRTTLIEKLRKYNFEKDGKNDE